ncbi:precorrin-6y C5,15-methyltransferase (decarboxylating) subunit CbiE [Nitrospira sp. Kam-Ns4a]
MTARGANERILVVGVPPGGPAGWSMDLRRRVQRAEILCGAPRHLAALPGVGRERWPITDNVLEIVERLRAAPSKRVVVLASGDPLLFGIGATLARALGPDRLEIVPQVSAVQAAFARIGVPWHDALILSAHGRPIESVVAAALSHPKVALYTDGVNTPARVAAALLAAGSPDRRTVVAERLGEAGERIAAGTLRAVAADRFDPLNVLLILEPVSGQGLPSGEALEVDEAALETWRGQVTRREVRALVLAALGARPGWVVWDVGAGAGAVSIELARRMPGAPIFAVERDPEQLRCLRTNLARHRAGSVTVVEGEAPDVLSRLPDPQAVFIGGTGGKLTAVLTHCWQRLAPEGRLVANLVVLGHLSEFLAWCAPAGATPEVLQVQLARGVPIAGSLRLEALNPVYLVAARRGGGPGLRPEEAAGAGT